MRRKWACWVWFVVAGLAPCVVHADVESGLVGYWPLNEGTGTTAADMSGNGHDGTLYRGATWISPGFLGHAAIRVDGNPGSRVSVGTWDPGDRFSLAIWAKWTGEQSKAERAGLIGKRNNWTAADMRWFVEVMTTGQVRMRNFTQTVSSPAGAMTAWIDQWVHVAVTCDGSTARIYLNGEQVGSGNFTPGPLKTAGMGLGIKEGGSNSNTEVFSGDIDEARIYDRVLSVGDLKELFEWTDLPGKAAGPRPADGQTDVARDVLLSWTPGPFTPPTNGHRVYFSENPDDVANGIGAVAQDASTFTPPQPLDFGKTYYWRVDEVDQTPDKPLFKGVVWSFTVEPYAFPVRPAAAKASSAQPDMGPEKTINGAGLTGDRHGVDSNTMWVSDGSTLPNWIQYEFEDVYKLHEIVVWNSNQALEGFLGFGAKSVTIETSIDGATWTAVAGVPEFARAPGAAGYAANTTVNLGGVAAQYVKLTINSTWSGATAASLSEVRFSSIPVRARLPQPASGTTDVPVDADLDWRPGREAASHQVYFGVDAGAVADGTAPAQVVGDHGYDPGSLDFGTTYFWKVDEVNEAMDPSLYEGPVWRFTTQEYVMIDDMESYNDSENRIYDTWLDGYLDQSSGSIIGHLDAVGGTFGERTVVHGGKQSMPFEYNNVNPPFFSEAAREFSPVQDWTVNGADTLSLWVRGNPPAYVEAAGTITMSAAGHDIWDAADDFRFAHKTLTGNGSVTVRVESIANTHGWAKAGVMIRQSLDADSKFVYFILSVANGVSLGWRPQVAGTCTSINQAAIPAPQWVKLARTGDVFTAQYSADGKTWTDHKNADGTIASTTVAMTGPVYVGLCVTSHDPAKTTTAKMSDLSITGTVGGSWQVTAIGDDPQTANDPADLYVAIQDSAGKTATAANPTAVNSADWTQWRIPLSSLTGVNLARVKKLSIGVGSKTSPVKGGAGMLYIDDIAFGHPAQ